MNIKAKIKYLILLIGVMIVFSGCTKDDNMATSALKSIYNQYKDGEISICNYNGNKVYTAALNAYDAGFQIFDINGKQTYDCNISWGQEVDKICVELTSCEVIYRVENNIWGEPPVDKYKLGN